MRNLILSHPLGDKIMPDLATRMTEDHPAGQPTPLGGQENIEVNPWTEEGTPVPEGDLQKTAQETPSHLVEQTRRGREEPGPMEDDNPSVMLLCHLCA